MPKFTNGKSLWRWWVEDVGDCKPHYKGYRGYGEKPAPSYDAGEVWWVVFITIGAAILTFVGSLILLAVTVASRGIVPMILLLLGLAIYAVYYAVKATVMKAGEDE